MDRKPRAAVPRQTQGKVRTSGPLIHLLILLILGAVGWELWTMQEKVRSAREEQAALQTQARQLQEENAALEQDIQEGATQDKMEDLARSGLGLAKGNEYIFYDRQN